MGVELPRGEGGAGKRTTFFETNDLSIGLLVTDRCQQIDAWLRNAQPEIKHRYDVWHVAKCKAKYNN